MAAHILQAADDVRPTTVALSRAIYQEFGCLPSAMQASRIKRKLAELRAATVSARFARIESYMAHLKQADPMSTSCFSKQGSTFQGRFQPWMLPKRARQIRAGHVP